MTVNQRYPLALPPRLSLESVAQQSGMHPDLVIRFVSLSLVEAVTDASGRMWFAQSTPSKIARIQRLRSGLSLNYAAIGLVLDLLDRIDSLERQIGKGMNQPWT